MRRQSFFFFLILIMSGCFKEEPKLPQYYAEQEIDVAVDSVICHSAQEDFGYFILTCSTPFDSLHWYEGYQNQDFLGSGQPLYLPNDPFGLTVIKCLGFSNADTTEFFLELNYCTRYMYIPTTFTPNQDGTNDSWFPVYASNDIGVLASSISIHWEIRTLDGVKIFETDDRDGKWDGRFNGYQMPHGAYLYYIELTISGEDPIEYTGSLEMLG